ncbi:DUF6497 family protein [uncultured Tateyamaria sp.]|uniref:DUF6497 family protein n=1 Tax=uncultured Tateyamaria sp. TaxID=455651 RepID=UPI002609C58A|nr:DUF6497 family protein [uncultured Tateyamaria sp.]
MASPAVAQEQPQAIREVPSGQSLRLSEVLIDTVGSDNWLRFRFLAPQIARDGGDVSYSAAEPDFMHLCNRFARQYIEEFELEADVIAISMMDRPVPFGQSDAQATQFFEVFRIAEDSCVWDGF